MPCFHPLDAWRDDSGQVQFYDRGRGNHMLLPCGRCVGCRLERSRQWATRMMFESQLHAESSFLTLTYDEVHLPRPPSLDYRHFQLFMKRLRKKLAKPLRFYCCGEYGDENGRPHFHAAIFGDAFLGDRYYWSKGSKGDKLYRSPLLESVWTSGSSLIGDLTFESAAYMARYIMKKITGDLAESHYQYLDCDSGEVFQLTPEFCHMSLKPGIGGKWFDLYSSDVYNGHDFVIVNGHKVKPPRYFDKLLRRLDSDLLRDVKESRDYRGYLNRFESSDDRLRVREKVALAALTHSTSTRSI